MNKKVYLAPIKGITDSTFRNVFSSCFSGIDAAVVPFITASDSEKKLRESVFSHNDLILIPQILTKTEETFITLAKKFADYGSCEINWNLGCPFKKVIDRGEGSALLHNPEAIDRFLDKICNASLPPLSVKMRLGLYSADEVFPVIKIMNNYPLKQIIIHPRTAEQMYEGNININVFNEAVKLSHHKIIYNGDITHYTDIDSIKSETGELHGWMIGRGILINPFLAEEILTGKYIYPADKIERLKQFINTLFKQYQTDLHSPAHVLDKMRGIWSYLSQNFSNPKKVDKRIRKASGIKHYLDEVDRIFRSDNLIVDSKSLIPEQNK